MAELEAAADTALLKVKGLSEQVQEAEEALATLDSELARILAELEADGSALREDARRLTAQAAAAHERLTQEGQEAAAALEDFEEQAASAQAECAREAQETRGQVGELEAAAESGQGRVREGAERVGAALRELARRTGEIEAALEAALAEAAGLADEMKGELEGLHQAVQTEAEAVHSFLSDDCAQEVERIVAEYDRSMAALEDFLDQQFAQMRQHAEETVSFSLAECAREVEEALPEDAAEACVLAINDVGAAAAENGEELDRARACLVEDLEATIARAEAAYAGLVAMEDLMAEYGFA